MHWRKISGAFYHFQTCQIELTQNNWGFLVGAPETTLHFYYNLLKINKSVSKNILSALPCTFSAASGRNKNYLTFYYFQIELKQNMCRFFVTI